MNAISIPLSPSLEAWVEQRVAGGDYVDVSDYVRDLLRRDQDRQREIERVRALVDEGLASGVVEAEPEDALAGIVADISDTP